MQAAIATLIGVMGTGLITVFIHFLRSIPERIDRLEDKFEGHISRLEDKFEGHISRLEDKFEGHISRLEDKFEGHIKRLEDKVDDLRDEVHQGFREQGERIARLENPPDPDAPAEAA
ncbi:hypothetical protein [Candidatus Poriferisocius sp.]|uniref:hypothetical protein n=1 Tax=Candidatus Poriferisocius sp. TaxID=3101276 RepID=UPI003B529E35